MKGLILAAGKGSRLFPITHHIPKPLLPVANRPTLHYAFDHLKELGIVDVCIVVGENQAQMQEALGDGSEFGLRLAYVRQLEPKGLAHAVSFAEDWVDREPFALYLGDAIYGKSFKPYAEEFLQSGAANLDILKVVEDPTRFGIAVVKGGRITKLVEKPKNPESNLTLAGMYFFGPQIWDVLPNLQPSARGEYEITDAIQLLVDRGELCLPGIYDGDWFDTGVLDAYLETNAFLQSGRNLIDPSAVVKGEVGQGVTIGGGAVVKCGSIADSVVLPGAHVEVSGDIRHSILGGHIVAEGLDSAICWNEERA